VLYLAEVKKQKGFMGSSCSLKLLACQRNDKSWSAVSGEEINADQASALADGALVMVNLGNNQQLQDAPTPATDRIVRILQDFSRLKEKADQQEEEIEQWKESLTIQGEQLNEREQEIQAKLAELEELQEQKTTLEEESNRIKGIKEEADKIRAEFDQKNQELEGAWQQLKAEQLKMEEKVQELSQNSSLDDAQYEQLKSGLQSLSQYLIDPETLKQSFMDINNGMNLYQELLTQYWQELQTEKERIKERHHKLEENKANLNQEHQQLEQISSTLEEAKSQLKTQQLLLVSKHESLELINDHLQNKQDLKDQLTAMAAGSAFDNDLSKKVNMDSLEIMPLMELETMVENLRTDLERLVGFVNDQEEELNYQKEAVEEIKAKLETANEYDRINLEAELSQEQESYTMLDDSIEGSRRNLLEREEIFKVHLGVLNRRKGIVNMDNSGNQIDFSPLIASVDEQYEQLCEEQRKFEQEIEQLNDSIHQVENVISQHQDEYHKKQQKWQEVQGQWEQEQEAINQLQLKIKVYEAILQPLQDKMDSLRAQVDQLAALEQEANSHQADFNETMGSLDSLLNQLKG
jgi:chromosome segregation ATPase